MENMDNNLMGSETKQEKGVGGLIGVIIIVIVLIIGAWYFFSQQVAKVEQQKQNMEVIDESQLSTSTEIIDLQSDLEKVNIESLDL